MKVLNITTIRKQVNEFLLPLGYSASVEKEPDGISIEPDTRRTGKKRKDYFDGMAIMYWQRTGIFEVAEYQAGKKEDEAWIYKETKSLKVALKDLIKGNKRKPIKVW